MKSILIMLGGVAFRTYHPLFFRPLIFGGNQFGANDTSRNSYNGVTHQHNDGSNKFARDGNGSNIPKSNGGQGDYGPIHGHGDAGKTVIWTFDNKHHRTHDQDDGDYRKQKNLDLDPTGLEGFLEIIIIGGQ